MTLKKLLLSLLILIPSISFAEPAGDLSLNGTASFVSRDGKNLILGTEGDDDVIFRQNNATTLTLDGATGVVSGSIVPTLPNNTYLKARNTADNADVPLLRLDSGDNTVLTSNTANGIFLVPRQDLNRYIKYDAASDTALTLQFGDTGTTAAQTLSILASTADADDDSSLCLGGGGACAAGAGGYVRGAVIVANGNEKSGDTGTLYIQGGGVTGADVFIRSEDDIVLETTTGTDALVVDTATGNATLPLGDVILSTSGKTVSIQENSASTACLGVTTPNGTTPVTVTTSCAVSGARIFYSRNGAVTNVGVVTTTTAPNGTSFAFASTNASDTTTSVVWWIIKESA